MELVLKRPGLVFIFTDIRGGILRGIAPGILLCNKKKSDNFMARRFRVTRWDRTVAVTFPQDSVWFDNQKLLSGAIDPPAVTYCYHGETETKMWRPGGKVDDPKASRSTIQGGLDDENVTCDVIAESFVHKPELAVEESSQEKSVTSDAAAVEMAKVVTECGQETLEVLMPEEQARMIVEEVANEEIVSHAAQVCFLAA